VAAAGAAARLLAGLADVVVHAAILVVLAAGSRLLGVTGLLPWPPLLFCLALFSFLYSVVPLAFWGQTPGMAWRGLVARGSHDEPLAFGQAARRWLGSLLTAFLAGLPLLLAPRRRTLSDLVSGSLTCRK
jgi:uncharacterized RDD family membrane protein YckC